MFLIYPLISLGCLVLRRKRSSGGDGEMGLIVQKYGGTSVGSIERIKHVAANILRSVQDGDQVVAVISAMGDQTDELLAMAHAISANPPRRELDMLLTSGERIAMALVTIALNEIGQKAVSLTGSQSGVITDTVHGNARISRIGPFRIQENLSSGNVVIVAGFQGVSAESKEITTLGRGGSDLSAIALGAALGARKVQLFKDVEGVCSADPRIVPQAKVISEIDWVTMTEMAWSGASVLHPRGAHLAAKHNIPVEIRSSFHLDRKGTLIRGDLKLEKAVVQGITHKKSMVILKGSVSAQSGETFQKLRTWLWSQGESPQIQIQISSHHGIDFCWSVPETLAQEAAKILSQGTSGGTTVHVEKCSLITIVGSGFWQSPETMEMIVQSVPSNRMIDVKNQSITLAVTADQMDESVKKLHQALIG
jgi:aspartate kinase